MRSYGLDGRFQLRPQVLKTQLFLTVRTHRKEEVAKDANDLFLKKRRSLGPKDSNISGSHSLSLFLFYWRSWGTYQPVEEKKVCECDPDVSPWALISFHLTPAAAGWSNDNGAQACCSRCWSAIIKEIKTLRTILFSSFSSFRTIHHQPAGCDGPKEEEENKCPQGMPFL